jgi:hypothetical protein
MGNPNATRREFVEALEVWCKLQDAGRADSEAGYAAWETVWRYAPEWFKDKARALAGGAGLIPDPAGYDADANPVYRLADVAERLGTSEQALLEQSPHMATRTPPFHRIN